MEALIAVLYGLGVTMVFGSVVWHRDNLSEIHHRQLMADLRVEPESACSNCGHPFLYHEQNVYHYGACTGVQGIACDIQCCRFREVGIELHPEWEPVDESYPPDREWW